MNRIYLDNASTTALRAEVIAEMLDVLENNYGNPSSTHSFGRKARATLELSRNTIAKQLNCSAQEIIFTSCGTEGNNWILRSAVRDLGITQIISSKIEHHAVLHTLETLSQEYGTIIKYVSLKPNGDIDLSHLSHLLSEADGSPTLVSLMHVNNEIGTVLDLNTVGKMCKEHSALFHSDTVQSVGKIEIDLQNLNLDFIVSSAHKFHGPKGIGFAFVKKNTRVHPLICGGEQEKGLRAGTEAVHQAAGMAKALELSYDNLKEERKHITNLKQTLVESIRKEFAGTMLNGEKTETDINTPFGTFYNIANISLPFDDEKAALTLFNLDMKGIAVSKGSACQSGSSTGSHVLAEILSPQDLKKLGMRISFSSFNTIQDIEALIQALKASY